MSEGVRSDLSHALEKLEKLENWKRWRMSDPHQIWLWPSEICWLFLTGWMNYSHFPQTGYKTQVYILETCWTYCSKCMLFYACQGYISVWIYLTMLFIPVIQTLASLRQSLVSHDPSEIILIFWFAAHICQECVINRNCNRITFIWNGNIL